MNKIFTKVFFLISFLTSIVFAQENLFYSEGIAALAENNINSAETSFKKSIKEYKDIPSFFELAKIYISKETVDGRRRARELLQKAVLIDKKNIECRMLLADLYWKFSGKMAFDEYEDIIEIDSTYSRAWYNLGKIKEEDFYDYNNSIMYEPGDDASLSYESFAKNDFLEAETYFKKAIKYDSLNPDSYLHLSFLYEDAEKIDEGISVLKKLIRIVPDNKDAHLYLGLLFYKDGKIEESYAEYQNALILMPIAERMDFTLNSVHELINPAAEDDLKKLNPLEVREFINAFWNASDPLYLTKYNERLLEHYSRVAYANLRFGKPGKSGWKTDRGEIILRYGQPLSKIRYRPFINAGGRTSVMVKTDVWDYGNFSIGFEDPFMSGNFRFSSPSPGSRYNSQYAGDSQFFADYLRRTAFETYKPKYEGPPFSIPYKVAQFKNINNASKTDVYVNYAVELNDSLMQNKIDDSYKWGLFFKDKYFNSIFENTGNGNLSSLQKLKNIANKNYFINTCEMSVRPDSGRLAFEIIRNSDKGVSSNHFKFNARKFYKTNLDMSDILLASNISKDIKSEFPFKRNEINILPNPTETFSRENPLFIYYEVYNLKRNKDKLTNFEQQITIKKADKSSGIVSAVNSILNVIGIGNDENKITLSTNYQTKEINPQIYFQLNMDKYEPGDYILTATITDNISGEKTSQKTLIKWQQ